MFAPGNGTRRSTSLTIAGPARDFLFPCMAASLLFRPRSMILRARQPLERRPYTMLSHCEQCLRDDAGEIGNISRYSSESAGKPEFRSPDFRTRRQHMVPGTFVFDSQIQKVL